MKKSFVFSLLTASLVVLAPAPAQTAAAAAAPAAAIPAVTPSRVGIIHIQGALMSTKDGQKAAAELDAKYAPKKAEVEKLQQEIQQLQDQVRKGAATMTQDAKDKLARDIDDRNKRLQRTTEDAQAELDQDQNKILQTLLQKMNTVIDKYAVQNGFAVILDVSNQQGPVVWAASGVDITSDIIKLYDQAYPVAAAAPAAAPRPAAAAPKTPPAAPKK